MTDRRTFAPLPLFSALAKSRGTDPATSQIAAARMDRREGGLPSKAETHEARILAQVRVTPGLTPGQVARACGLDYHAVQRRVRGLCDKRLLAVGRRRECPVRDSLCHTLWPFGAVPAGQEPESPWEQ